MKFSAGTQTDKQVVVTKVIQDDKLVNGLKDKISSLETQLTKAKTNLDLKA